MEKGKMLIYLGISGFIVIIILIYYIYTGNHKIRPEILINTNTGEVITNDDIENSEVQLTEKEITEQRNNISLNDISKIYSLDSYEPKNKIEENGQKLISELKVYSGSKITDNIRGGIEISHLNTSLEKVPSIYKREMILDLTIFDSVSKEKINKGMVYVNGVKLGEFTNGKFEGKFEWLKGIEKFNVMVRSDLYGDGFLILNSLNSGGELLLGEVFLKKAKISYVFLGTKQEVNLNNTFIGLDECSIVNKNGDCVIGKVKIKVSNISGGEANNNLVTLDMQAITKEGDLVRLLSGGMSFIEFISEDGEILKLKEGNTIKIGYKVTDEDIKTMGYDKFGDGKKEGYWWYDKNAGIWNETEASYKLDEANKIWTAEVSNLY